MTESAEASFELLKNKAEQVFDPNFFGAYSFEYAYRLLLVYLSTNSTNIKGIRMSNPNAFDFVFQEEISKAIGYVLNYRGIVATPETRTKLTETANQSLVLYIKSSMLNPPQKVAKAVAKAMDKNVAQSMDHGSRLLVQKVFEE